MAYPDDFDRIYPLLAAHDSGIPRKVWRRLLERPWPAPFDHNGYLLMDRSRCVGFIGAIFSRRRIGGQDYNCCNISSWMVKQEYRSHSLSLLFPLLQLKDWVISNLTPSREVYHILTNLGFRRLETKLKLFLPFIQKRSPDCEILAEPADISPHLSGDQQEILSDHLPFDCLHLLVRSPQASCYLVVTKVVKKGVPLARIDYLSQPEIFLEHLGTVVNFIGIRWRVLAVMVDERLLANSADQRAFSYRLKQPRLYKGPGPDRHLLDNLYSELVMLGI